MNARLRRLTGGLGAGALLLGAAWYAWSSVDFARSRSVAKQYDMVGMLEEIHVTNQQIGLVNEGIARSLEQVQSEAGRITSVHQKLTGVAAGVEGQQALLDRLRVATAEQARLSEELQQLTASLTPNTVAMADTAGAEANVVAQMRQQTQGLASTMGEIVSVNGAIRSKLARAEELSAEILRQLP